MKEKLERYLAQYTNNGFGWILGMCSGVLSLAYFICPSKFYTLRFENVL